MSAVLKLGWSKDAIQTISCKVTYSTEYGVQTWNGDSFDVEITDPCIN